MAQYKMGGKASHYALFIGVTKGREKIIDREEPRAGEFHNQISPPKEEILGGLILMR